MPPATSSENVIHLTTQLEMLNRIANTQTGRSKSESISSTTSSAVDQDVNSLLVNSFQNKLKMENAAKLPSLMAMPPPPSQTATDMYVQQQQQQQAFLAHMQKLQQQQLQNRQQTQNQRLQNQQLQNQQLQNQRVQNQQQLWTQQQLQQQQRQFHNVLPSPLMPFNGPPPPIPFNATPQLFYNKPPPTQPSMFFIPQSDKVVGLMELRTHPPPNNAAVQLPNVLAPVQQQPANVNVAQTADGRKAQPTDVNRLVDKDKTATKPKDSAGAAAAASVQQSRVVERTVAMPVYKLQPAVKNFLKKGFHDEVENFLVEAKQLSTESYLQLIAKQLESKLRTEYPKVKAIPYGSRMTALSSPAGDLDINVDLGEFVIATFLIGCYFLTHTHTIIFQAITNVMLCKSSKKLNEL